MSPAEATSTTLSPTDATVEVEGRGNRLVIPPTTLSPTDATVEVEGIDCHKVGASREFIIRLRHSDKNGRPSRLESITPNACPIPFPELGSHSTYGIWMSPSLSLRELRIVLMDAANARASSYDTSRSCRLCSMEQPWKSRPTSTSERYVLGSWYSQ